MLDNISTGTQCIDDDGNGCVNKEGIMNVMTLTRILMSVRIRIRIPMMITRMQAIKNADEDEDAVDDGDVDHNENSGYDSNNDSYAGVGSGAVQIIIAWSDSEID